MKKIVFCLLLLTFSFRLAAQIDYLEPVKPFSTYTGELGEYYRSVFSLLNTGFQKQPYARFAAIPSFSPEYAMSVEKRNGRYTLVSNTLSRTYWQAEKGTVTVDTKSVVISASLYQSLGAIFRLVTVLRLVWMELFIFSLLRMLKVKSRWDVNGRRKRER